MDKDLIIEIIGWFGVIFYVFAYLLLSVGVLKSNGYVFHFLNMLGAIGLIINSYFHNDRPNLVVNIIWFFIGIFAITKRFFFTSARQQS